MAMWVYGIVDKHWSKLQRQAQSKTHSIHRALSDVLTGLKISPEDVRDAEVAAGIDLAHADAEGLQAFCREIVRISKPMVAVGNKVDQAPELMIDLLKGSHFIFTTAAGELALRNAAAAHLIRYLPGDRTFTILDEKALSPQQKAGLARIAEVMDMFSGTGVQQTIDHAIREVLRLIVVYPVEDEHKFTDSKGRVLPDAFLMKRGSTPRDLAFMVHTDIGKGFLYAVDARTSMRVKDTHELQDGDIIRIVSTAK
jgi:ribosome-binding ATPase YchF (GTP1/OBG family)